MFDSSPQVGPCLAEMSNRDPSLRHLGGIHPVLRPYAAAVVNDLREAGYPAVIVSGRRSQADQDRLYAQGRTAPGPVVTWTRNSYHVHGRAFDVAWLVDDRVTWDVPASWWRALGDVGEGYGFRWGGRWKSPDRPHLEY